MKLSTKGRYGARAMLDLALCSDGKPILLKDIAKRQEVSEKYLEHVFSSLKRANLVKSVRGSRGGYLLAKDPSKIKLSEIINTLEGSIAPVECVANEKLCHRASSCITRDIWCKLKESLIDVLDSFTLEEMVRSARAKNLKDGPNAHMYWI